MVREEDIGARVTKYAEDGRQRLIVDALGRVVREELDRAGRTVNVLTHVD